MKRFVFYIVTFIAAGNFTFQSTAQLTPQEAIGQMIKGINIGNTMELDPGLSWNKGPVKEYFFDDYKDVGFSCVRIPIRWDKHTGTTFPYKIDDSWLDTVEEVIDWGLERGLFIIINSHHDNWIKDNYNATNKARYDSIWSQVSTRFKDKSEKLFFEIINEPFGMTTAQVNDLNARTIPIIRQTNPTRIIIYSGREYTGASLLMEAAIPDDDYIMGYFHSYDPWSFAGEGNGTWGTSSDRNAAANRFKSVANWSALHNIPVMISEFGAVKKCDYNSRMYFYSVYVEEAIKNGIAYQVWDDGGDFGIYQRTSRTWPEVKDIVTKTDPLGPTLLKTQISGNTMKLMWTNRTAETGNIIIQRKTGSGNFMEVGQVEAGSTFFDDEGLPAGTYYYRVIVQRNDTIDMYSYPYKTTMTVTTGIEDVESMKFKIYPNPASHQISISYNDLKGNEMVEFFNFSGQFVKSVPINSTGSPISVNDLQRGIYFLRLKSDNKVSEKQKLIIR